MAIDMLNAFATGLQGATMAQQQADAKMAQKLKIMQGMMSSMGQGMEGAGALVGQTAGAATRLGEGIRTQGEWDANRQIREKQRTITSNQLDVERTIQDKLKELTIKVGDKDMTQADLAAFTALQNSYTAITKSQAERFRAQTDIERDRAGAEITSIENQNEIAVQQKRLIELQGDQLDHAIKTGDGKVILTDPNTGKKTEMTIRVAQEHMKLGMGTTQWSNAIKTGRVLTAQKNRMAKEIEQIDANIRGADSQAELNKANADNIKTRTLHAGWQAATAKYTSQAMETIWAGVDVSDTEAFQQALNKTTAIQRGFSGQIDGVSQIVANNLSVLEQIGTDYLKAVENGDEKLAGELKQKYDTTSKLYRDNLVSISQEGNVSYAKWRSYKDYYDNITDPANGWPEGTEPLTQQEFFGLMSGAGRGYPNTDSQTGAFYKGNTHVSRDAIGNILANNQRYLSMNHYAQGGEWHSKLISPTIHRMEKMSENPDSEDAISLREDLKKNAMEDMAYGIFSKSLKSITGNELKSIKKRLSQDGEFTKEQFGDSLMESVIFNMVETSPISAFHDQLITGGKLKNVLARLGYGGNEKGIDNIVSAMLKEMEEEGMDESLARSYVSKDVNQNSFLTKGISFGERKLARSYLNLQGLLKAEVKPTEHELLNNYYLTKPESGKYYSGIAGTGAKEDTEAFRERYWDRYLREGVPSPTVIKTPVGTITTPLIDLNTKRESRSLADIARDDRVKEGSSVSIPEVTAEEPAAATTVEPDTSVSTAPPSPVRLENNFTEKNRKEITSFISDLVNPETGGMTQSKMKELSAYIKSMELKPDHYERAFSAAIKELNRVRKEVKGKAVKPAVTEPASTEIEAPPRRVIGGSFEDIGTTETPTTAPPSPVRLENNFTDKNRNFIQLYIDDWASPDTGIVPRHKMRELAMRINNMELTESEAERALAFMRKELDKAKKKDEVVKPASRELARTSPTPEADETTIVAGEPSPLLNPILDQVDVGHPNSRNYISAKDLASRIREVRSKGGQLRDVAKGWGAVDRLGPYLSKLTPAQESILLDRLDNIARFSPELTVEEWQSAGLPPAVTPTKPAIVSAPTDIAPDPLKEGRLVIGGSFEDIETGITEEQYKAIDGRMAKDTPLRAAVMQVAEMDRPVKSAQLMKYWIENKDKVALRTLGGSMGQKILQLSPEDQAKVVTALEVIIAGSN